MSKFLGVQQDILNSVADTQLVSAGAGSGKTTIMIEKLTNLIINERVDVDNLLVVTFTVLAAQEMKDRLNQSLINALETATDKERVLDAIEKLKTASIDTFDGFNSKTIKKYFYALNLSPNQEILSGTTQEYYLVKSMDKTLENADESDLLVLLDIFGGNARNYETIKKLIFKTYQKISNEIDPYAFLDICKNEYQNSAKSANVVNKYVIGCVEAFLSEIKSVYIDDDKLRANILEATKCLFDINENLPLQSNLQALYSFKPLTITSKMIDKFPMLEDVKQRQTIVVNCQKKLKEIGIDTDFQAKNEEILKIFEIFSKILISFMSNYSNLKQKNNMLDFTDMTRLVIKLFDDVDVLTELQNKYKYIFIDEYQDVNPLQDYLMAKLTTDETKLFMVGDLKQSIYGFRGSSPEMFLNKYTDIKQKRKSGEAFDMNLNFRSNSKILDFINEMFSSLMTTTSSDIDFKTDCIIESKRQDIPTQKVEIAIFEKQEAETVPSGIYSVQNDIGGCDTEPKEEDYIVGEILRLVGKDFYDASMGQNRQLEYKDIAILSNSEKSDAVKSLIAKLQSKGIKVNSNTDFDIKSSESLALIKSILKCALSSGDDVDYLATFLALSPITIDEIVAIRNNETSLYQNLVSSNSVDVKACFDLLEVIKLNSYNKSNSGLIRYLLDDLKLRYFILKMPAGESELFLLEQFLSSISNSVDSLNLSEFLSFLESGINTEETFNISDSQNSVTIQTIHKSKGLEYPVVFIFDAGKEFSKDIDIVNYNTNIGLGFDYFDLEKRIKSGSVTKFAISILNQAKLKKEKLRLLYVALTRAKNKLYITGSVDLNDLKKDNSFLGMILSSYKNEDLTHDIEKDNCEIRINPNVNEDKPCTQQTGNIITKFKDGFIYPNQDKFNLVFKNTVTNINSAKAQQCGYKLAEITQPETQYSAEEIKAIGTNYHKALELLDLSKEYQKNSDFTDVDYNLIKTAHKILSPLSRGAKIKKEAEFLMYLPYSELTDSLVSDKVLVQGVVDLMFIYSDHIDIVDYKFSNLDVAVLKSKYIEQLKLYKLACEKAYNLPVKNVWIYSIKSGELA